MHCGLILAHRGTHWGFTLIDLLWFKFSTKKTLGNHADMRYGLMLAHRGTRWGFTLIGALWFKISTKKTLGNHADMCAMA